MRRRHDSRPVKLYGEVQVFRVHFVIACVHLRTVSIGLHTDVTSVHIDIIAADVDLDITSVHIDIITADVDLDVARVHFNILTARATSGQYKADDQQGKKSLILHATMRII